MKTKKMKLGKMTLAGIALKKIAFEKMAFEKKQTWMLLLFLVCLIACFGNIAKAQSSATGPHIEVALLSEKSALVPGNTQYLAIQMTPDEEWHTYWRNPGDSGEAPKLEWKETEGVNFGEILWPTPDQIPVAHLVNYGYSGSHLLMVPVTINKNLPLSTVSAQSEGIELVADLSWLVCKEDCIPGWATLTLTLPIASQSKFTDEAALFSDTRKALPTEEPRNSVYEINESTIAIEFDTPSSLGDQEALAFPFNNSLIDHAGSQQHATIHSRTSIILPRGAYFDPQTIQDESPELRFLIKSANSAFYIVAQPSQDGSSGGTAEISMQTIVLMLFFAFLGGLILNVMPCVLPILSMKAISLQHEQIGLIKKLAYGLGVLACFNLFALVVVLLQQGGEQLGWGFHMQSPLIIWLLAFLFTFIALLLLDVFSVGSAMAGLGNNLVTGDNARSHFFTGFLAVVVASPCTAPFMAAALGIAFVSSPTVTFLIFNALAVGFALPLTLLFIAKNLRQFLPKPGNWMVTFKYFLAFPMFFTVAWLCWVYAGQQGAVAQFVLLCALITFALLAWLSSKVNRFLAAIFTLFIIVLAILPVLPNTQLLNANSTVKKTHSNESLPFDREQLESLLSEGEVVLVNMTADWCITCKVNEQVALNTETVTEALNQDGVTYMLGDWTNKNDEILAYLKEYERAGVPLYVVYAGQKSKQVLPQMLTPGIVVNALNQAQKELQNEN